MLKNGIDQFTVKQAKGKDSIVDVTEDVQVGYPNDTKILIFDTDQSLLSNSDRAENVEQAIKAYADKRGYQMPRTITETKQVRAVYSEDHYSSVKAFKLRKAIEAHADFIETAETARFFAKQVNGSYGKHIKELKHLIFLLEQALDIELKKIAFNVVKKQKEIIETMDTKGIKDRHIFANAHPLIKIDSDYHYNHTDEIPDDLDAILALLD